MQHNTRASSSSPHPPAAANDDHAEFCTEAEVRRRLRVVEPELHGMVRGATGKRGWSLPDDVIDDVVQRLRIQLWQADLRRFQPRRGNLFSFVRQRAAWMVTDEVRARARRKDLEGDACTAALQAASLPDLLQQAERRRLQEGLEQRVTTTLQCPLERASVLAHTQDETLKQVALRLAVHPSRATRAKQRGIAKLKASAKPPRW